MQQPELWRVPSSYVGHALLRMRVTRSLGISVFFGALAKVGFDCWIRPVFFGFIVFMEVSDSETLKRRPIAGAALFSSLHTATASLLRPPSSPRQDVKLSTTVAWHLEQVMFTLQANSYRFATSQSQHFALQALQHKPYLDWSSQARLRNV